MPFLLLRQKTLAGLDPVFVRYDFVRRHFSSPVSGSVILGLPPKKRWHYILVIAIILRIATGSKGVDVYHAIADGNRRKLLELLSERERSVQELMPHFDVTMGAVSQHLKILRANGLVARRKQGRFRFYRASPKALQDVDAWTEQYRQFWDSSLDRLGDYLDKKA
jgi:DNA-binding transcriptional ArsR family regulator